MHTKINHLKLKAMRQSLGLTVAEACEFVPNAQGEPISKRYFQYLENGERSISDEIGLLFSIKASHYKLLLNLITKDIEQFNKDNPHSHINNTNKCLSLPFFHSFEDFVECTNNDSRVYWKIWQSVLGHLILTNVLNHLNDDATIPTNFQSWWWLKGDYSKIDDCVSNTANFY